jgi:hypothetical protein
LASDEIGVVDEKQHSPFEAHRIRALLDWAILEACDHGRGKLSGAFRRSKHPSTILAMSDRQFRYTRSIVPALLAAAMFSGCGPTDVPAQTIEPSLFETTGVLASWRLAETSGLRLLDASVVDWEDIAVGPCPDSTTSCVFVGDVGDNSEARTRVDVYFFPEPDTLPDPRQATSMTVRAERLSVRYHEGAQDVEALAVTAQGSVLLITKGRSGEVGLYRIPRGALQGDSVTVSRVEILDIVPQFTLGRYVTGAAASREGGRLVVRTYTELIFYQLDSEERPSRVGACWLGLREAQGEAVDILDDSTLVLTSEAGFGRPATISRVRCPIP